MFKTHQTYTHNRMLDVAVYVLKSFRCPDGRYKLKVRWVYRNGMDLRLVENVTVVRNEIKNWYQI
jgi:hypothetical protein